MRTVTDNDNDIADWGVERGRGDLQGKFPEGALRASSSRQRSLVNRRDISPQTVRNVPFTE